MPTLGLDERYWGTPPELYDVLSERFGPFDCDPCPHPVPAGYDGRIAPWGRCNYVNPPFGGPGAFVRRAIAELEHGNESLLVLPVTWWTHVLLCAGARVHPIGRVRWLELDSRTPDPKHPGLTAAFYLDPARSKCTPLLQRSTSPVCAPVS